MEVNVPRILISAGKSGSGKTTVTCALLQALVNRKVNTAAVKCGPDYIDPMFASEVIEAPARNIDLFLSTPETVTYLLSKNAATADITIMEGAMGFYDGIALSDQASAWDAAKTTSTPVVLVVDGRGRARSLVAEIKGFIDFRKPSNIAGVIINHTNEAMFSRFKEMINEELNIETFGYLPTLEDCQIESRHLGLVTAGEIDDIKERLNKLAIAAEKYIDIDALITCAHQAPKINNDKPKELVDLEQESLKLAGRARIAVAKDEAFCFYYADALDMLRDFGAEIIEFSPLHDEALPDNIDAIYIGGGYPELYLEKLSSNKKIQQQIYASITSGMPYVAECGGFLYLHKFVSDLDGHAYPLVGYFECEAYPVNRLGRFGYITATSNKDGLFGPAGTRLTSHEFHYWESSCPGVDFRAEKPQSSRFWDCGHISSVGYAGFPHFYFPGNPFAAYRFVAAAKRYNAHFERTCS